MVGAQTVTVAFSGDAHRRLEVITTLPPDFSPSARSTPIGDGWGAEALRTCELVGVVGL